MRTFLATLLVCLASLAPVFAQGKGDDYNKEQRKGYEALTAGRLDEGIASMKRCLELLPEDSTSAYNLACAYSLKKEVDTAFDWFNKSIDWGFLFAASTNLTWPDTDKDLDNIRADPRYAQAMERIKAQAKKAEEYWSKPIVYVPEAIKSAETKPLLVVLHASGSTKDQAFEKGPWKKLADELGTALILPSAKLPVKFKPEVAPQEGMNWTAVDFYGGQATWRYEKPVDDAVSAFKKEHKIDPAKVWIAGEGEGGTVAFDIAVSKPGFYKGVLVVCGAPALNIAQAKPATAGKMGQRAYFLFDNQSVYGLEDAAQIDEVAKGLDGAFKKAGLAATIERFDKKADDPQQLEKLIANALKTLSTPAPAAPSQPVEAGGDKKQ
jgi:predicted esterase